jgi:transmembrane sensor
LKKEYENIDELLGKYLAGEASEEEGQIVTLWINESDENQKHFHQMKHIFESAAMIKDRQVYDADAAWNKVRSKIHRKNGRVIPMRADSAAQWWKIAAAVLITVSVGLYLWRNSEAEIQPVKVIAQKQAITDTLPDGTNVFLNRKTTLSYTYDKKKKLHDVRLDGEAYFNLQHGPGEEFVINAGEVFIRDIGTSFNVKAYPETDVVEVLVEDGEIIFYTADNPGIHLKESGRAVYHRKTKQFTIDQPEPNITAYKTKFFVFSDERLGDAVQALNNVYDVPIVINENLKNCPITVSFRNENIDEIAKIIAETLGLNVNRESNRITLTGKGCE